MSKKKIVFIVITVISVLASVVACALGIPYTAVDIDYSWLEGEDESVDSAVSEAQSEESVAVDEPLPTDTGA